MKATDPEAAIEEFLGVPALEPEKGDWGFKGLKQAIKLEFKLGQYEKVGKMSESLWRSDLDRRLLNITPSFSPMSATQLRVTTLKSPLIISSITLRKARRMRRQDAAWRSSTLRLYDPSRAPITNVSG
jgi:hypothetical protein